MLDNLKSDLQRHELTRYGQLRTLLLNTTVWAIACYRFRRWVLISKIHPLFRKILNIFGTVFQLWVDISTDIEFPPTAEIGSGLLCAHSGNIIVSRNAVLGENCTLTHGVTIGHAKGGSRGSGAPRIGDRVYIGPGASLIGPIEVGHDALIALGAVVTKSVPPRGVVVGMPATLHSTGGSFDLVEYPGMDDDPARQASLNQRIAPDSARKLASSSAGPR